MLDVQFRQLLDEVQQILRRLDSQDTQLTSLENETNKQTILLTGGVKPQEGIIVRLDRIEIRETNREWWVKAYILSAISAVITLIIGVFKK